VIAKDLFAVAGFIDSVLSIILVLITLYDRFTAKRKTAKHYRKNHRK
jgi:hypothetical protein